ncbi:hemicentin-2-like [Strongylocentrotus purpuratus]|uniref:Ig-like domain-containing protein n=1 Tax=Strongylocentrotus purpuratus TaxID=7668 RepID=A0A7M7P0K4_STRPU|nr:hemicentin-2-like [Strongylocentrotus purpuratus]
MTSQILLSFLLHVYLGSNFVTSQYMQQPTVITVSPQGGIEGPPGREYEIKCRASWYRTPPEVEWTFNGRRIFDGNKYVIDIEQTQLEDATISSLFIQNARPMDSGRYGCRMQAPAFGLASTTFKVFPQPVLMPSPHQVIDRDANMTLRCPARGNFGGNLFWIKDNIVIGGQAGVYDPNRDRIPDYWVVDNERMVIINANIQNAGVYRCQYRYFFHGRHQNVAEIINVNSPVELVTAPLIRWQELPNGGPLRLECKARGFPRPRIAWTYSNFTFESGGYMDKNVSIVTSPQSQTIVTSVLSVRHMPDKFNVARFNCSGQNSVSRASKLIMVVNMGTSGQVPNRGPNTGTSTGAACVGTSSSLILVAFGTSCILIKSFWDTR